MTPWHETPIDSLQGAEVAPEHVSVVVEERVSLEAGT